jgi:F5/8 type C domain
MKLSRRIARVRSRRWKAALAALLALAFVAAGVQVASAATNITSGPGRDFFSNSAGGWRYGPSIITDSTGIHVYTCSPGTGGAWDFIRYTTSTDGGVTWSPDQIVLQPTPGSQDTYSTCDPGVVAFGGYYYLAYTSTTDSRGTNNNVFVARSTSMTGPFDKWNGSGWGGNPSPMVTYSGPTYDYGAGEPSLVVVGSTLYVFYSWNSADPTTGTPIQQTRLSTVSTSSPNWPSGLAYQGVAITKRFDQGTDSDDVKWVPSWGKFIAVNTAQRFGPLSYVQAWESTNGLNFSPANFNSGNLKKYLHNDGLSGDASGNLDPTTQNYIGYAYGSTWGSWSSSLDPVTLTNDTLPASPQIYTTLSGNQSARIEFQTDSKATSYTVHYGTSPGSYTSTVTGITASPYTLTGLTNGATYYVALSASGSTGASGLGADVSIVPQNFQPVALSSATAASTLSGYPASNAIDGNPSTLYSSVGHSSSTATEWLSVDTGSVQNIGRVLLTDRQPNLLASPNLDSSQDAVVQTSVDGTTWTTIDTRTTMSSIIDSSGVPRTVLTFPRPISARYVRVYSTRLNADDLSTYYLQIAELEVDSVPGGPISSSAIGSLPAQNLTDADPSTVYSSALHSSSAATEWAGIDLGSAQTVSRLLVTPRATGYCFPVNFSIQSSPDGTTWTTVPGQTYSAFPNPGSVQQSFAFGTAVTARYFRLLATTLGVDNTGNYALQFGDIAVDKSMTETASASSVANSAYVASNGVDQVNGTAWSSAGHSTAANTEWFQVDLGSSRTFQNIFIDPNNQSFPAAFSISSSTDGTTWTPLPGQSYASYTDPASLGTTPPPIQQFHLTLPATAQYIRVTATTLRPDGFGNYYFQLRDLRVTG